MTTAAVLAQMGSNNTTFRNRIYNGAMMIDQRNAGASVSYSTASASYLVDRWYGQGVASAGVFTLQQSTDAPAGFSSSVKATVTTASTPSGTNVYRFIQRLEGYSLADLNLGTSNAASFTLSFWVKASVTGTFGGSFWGAGATRWFIFSYTINSANTWEYKTVTVSPVTSGTFQTTNSTALQLTFNLGAGSSVLGAAGSWISNDGSTEYYGPTGQTNLISTNGATFYITGVQLEAGTNATPFEFRPYGTELALCQRYYWQSFQGQTPSGWGANFLTTTGYQGAALTTGMINQNFFLPVPMRAAPTGAVWDHLGASGKISSFNPNVANNGGETGSIVNTSTTTFMINRTSGANASQIGAYVSLNSEL